MDRVPISCQAETVVLNQKFRIRIILSGIILDSFVFDASAMRSRIKEEIERQHRTQADVASKANLGHGYLTNILLRDQMPSVEKMDALCRELNVSILWIMYGIPLPRNFHLIQEIARRDSKKFRAILELLE